MALTRAEGGIQPPKPTAGQSRAQEPTLFCEQEDPHAGGDRAAKGLSTLRPAELRARWRWTGGPQCRWACCCRYRAPRRGPGILASLTRPPPKALGGPTETLGVKPPLVTNSEQVAEMGTRGLHAGCLPPS